MKEILDLVDSFIRGKSVVTPEPGISYWMVHSNSAIEVEYKGFGFNVDNSDVEHLFHAASDGTKKWKKDIGYYTLFNDCNTACFVSVYKRKIKNMLT